MYATDQIPLTDIANAVIYGIRSLLETGEYVDTTGIAETTIYPPTTKSKNQISEQDSLSLNRDNASEVADNVLAVTPEMEAEANETSNSGEVAEEVKGLSALEDLQKRYAEYRKRISSQREKRLTTFDTKRIFLFKI